MNEPRHFNTADWPWDCADWEIANLVEIGVLHVRLIRRLVFGRNMPTLKFDSKYGKLPWGDMDWSDSNGAIASKLNVDPQVVARYRQYHGISQYTGTGKNRDQLRVVEAMKDVDWDWERDFDIAIRFGLTRERVRQLRLQFGKPVPMVHRMSKDCAERARWARDNRERITGKHWHEVVKLFPNQTNMEVEKRHWIRINHALGLKLLFYNKAEKTASWRDAVNWKIPGCVLSVIWDTAAMDSLRYRYRLGPASWDARSRVWKDGAFKIPLLQREITTALRHGHIRNPLRVCETLGIPPLPEWLNNNLDSSNQNLNTPAR